MKIINFKKNKTNKHLVTAGNSYLQTNSRNHTKMLRYVMFIKDKKYRKVRDYCHYTGQYKDAAHSIGNLKYSIPKEIPIVFHNGSNYDYHFIVKELAEKFEGKFNCLAENIE